MKKTLFVSLLLLMPLLANAQLWFKANAVRFDINEKWRECNIPVVINDDWKINIYAKVHHTIRKTKSLGDMVDGDGNKHCLWAGVNENGEECTISLTKFKHIPYSRLTITYKHMAVYYMLSEDN